MSSENSGQERAHLYAEGIEEMVNNPNLPQLFRDIFRNAYIPYRDPDTLNMFLKEISEFNYDNSEDLGNAFEYLLSIMGSQGDAGQFRTPRHIIDMIVEIVQPTKNDTILDPACGTAGFLISAYKYILESNKDVNGNSTLSADDRKRMTSNFEGYDISPDMVRLARVNMYLHKFTKPQISEYDTLTSEEKWDDSFDVILANPPFMTPKGGIQPHRRYQVQAKRAEVLFVDYITEHLNPTGRAGIIVPEGIVFQSANAYKSLRKHLVEGNNLYAVISLPSGVFNPYSGVKTSILLIDKTIAKQRDKILFVKLENDGFDLGAQRKELKGSQVQDVINIVNDYKDRKDVSGSPLVTVASKEKIAGEDYILVGERYGAKKEVASKYPILTLDEVCNFVRGPFGGSLKKEIFKSSGYLVYEQFHAINNDFTFGRYYIDEAKFNEMKRFEVFPNDILISCSGTMGKIAIVPDGNIKGIINQALLKLTP
jgi:type I restriction enzyme M protein